MKLIKEPLEGLKLLELQYFEDERGFFVETYGKKAYENVGITTTFVQDNHSYTAEKGTVRGIHFQLYPEAQSKLVHCIRGSVLDVAVDLRKESSTYLQWRSFVLSAENHRQVFIPQGFGHGFVSLEPHCEFIYKVDALYCPSLDRSIMWNDPDIAIDWGIENPILSEKDKKAPRLQDSDVNF